MQVVRFGKICFNLEIAALVIMLVSFLSVMISMAVMIMYYLVLFIVLIGSLFFILMDEGYRKLWSSSDWVTKIGDAMGQCWHYLTPVAGVLAVVSIVCLCFDKNQKHFVRIAISVLVALVTGIVCLGGMVQ